MDSQTLKSIIQSEINDASGYIGGDLSNQRTKAMEYYLGEPFGNEEEGRSQVVSRDVADTIEWIKPSLLKTFAASDQAVRFDPEGPEDEEQSEQETDYCNYVFYKENEGFLILYTWINDALLQKNGIVKVYWDEKEETTREAYKGLDDDEFMKLMMDEELEPIEHSQYNTPFETIGPQGPMMQEVLVHDVVFKRTRKRGKVSILPVPPEEFLINRDHNTLSVKDAAFVAHKVDRRVSDLIAEGYDRKTVEGLASEDSTSDTTEAIARRNLSDEYTAMSRNDKSMRKVKVYECYIRVDYDGDGIAELRKVTYAGSEILDNEECDRIPFEAITPVILSHKFHGLSIYDLISDIQLIKSTLMRGMLDNLYLTNNPMKEVAEGTNLDDLATNRPGGWVRTKMPGLVNTLDVPFVAGQSFPMLEYMDRVRQQRTGVSENTMGQNQAMLNDTAHGIERLMSAAEARVELIARIFAETGIKGLFKQIHELLQKHQDKAKVIKLRNKWVSIDPREWRTRMNLSAKVGLGTGDRLKMSQAIEGVMAIQEKLMAGGGKGILVTRKNIFNAVNDFAKYNGLNDAQAYFNDPDSPEAQEAIKAQESQQPMNPLAEVEQIKGQFKMQADQMKSDMEMSMKKKEMDIDNKKFLLEYFLDMAKAEIEGAAKGVKADLGQPGIGTETKQDGFMPALKLSVSELQGFGEQTSAGLAQLLQRVEAMEANSNQLGQSLAALMDKVSKPITIVRDKAGRVAGAVRE